jgi:hypothetical protein
VMGAALDDITAAGHRNRTEGRLVSVQAVFERASPRRTDGAAGRSRVSYRLPFPPSASTGRAWPTPPSIPPKCWNRCAAVARDASD